MKELSFKEMTITKGNLRATWEWIGEGRSGDYNEEDPNDQPLLRFTCDENNAGDWEQVENASYCTTVPITTPRKELRRMLNTILKELAGTYPDHKRAMEEMSWIGER
jgi:hypothetical protein